MLSPKTQLNLRNAKAYFREHLCVGDYYSESQHVRGYWYGQGAAALGLSGIVGEKDFLRLCDGLHPQTDQKLTLRRNTQRRENGRSVANRRVFYDFVISPPKSVSVVGLLKDVRVLGVHDDAVKAALIELERAAEARVRKGGAQASRVTGNLVAAVFRHDTSRELDPHLHSHCVVLNATFDPVENQWKALEAGGAFRVQKLVKQVYYHELCRGLRRLGYGVQPTARDFEIVGVPVETIARFSKRHAQIDAEAARQSQAGAVRGNVKDRREEIARSTRKVKVKATSAHALLRDWEAQLPRSERTALREVGDLPLPSAESELTARGLIAWADEHLFERRAIVDESELLATALARGRGSPVTLGALRTAIDEREYLRESDSPRLTSRDVLQRELALVMAAREGRNAYGPFAPDFRPSTKLSVEQERAVRAILTSADLITVFRGGAGTGKSFTLAEVHRGLVAAGFPVVVAAPQRQQVEGLIADSLPAQTLAHVLSTGHVPPRAVVIVDEAGQIGAQQLGDLVSLARQRGARLILSGDTRQHGAVAVSDALRALESYGQVRIAEIGAIRRQDPERGRTPSERQFIARYRAAVKAAAAGDIAGSFARLEKLGCIQESEGDARIAALAREYVAATQRKEATLVVGQTWTEVERANEAIRTALRDAGRLGAGKAVQTFRPIDTTIAQRRDPRSFLPGQRVYFVRRYGRFIRGDLCEVRGATAGGVVLAKAGIETTVSFRYADRFTLAESVMLELAVGDRLQLKVNGRSQEGHACNNGELVTVTGLPSDGGLIVSDSAGRIKTLSPAHRLCRRGYAVTSYGSQGKTVDTVLVSDAANRAATNRAQWYVTISRGRKRVVIFTSDRDALRAAISRHADRPLAMELQTRERAAVVLPRWVLQARERIAHLCRRAFLKRTQSAPTAHIRPTL